VVKSTESVHVDRDLFTRLAVTDPYPVYRELHAWNHPIRLSPRETVFVRHAEVMAVLRDDRFGRPKFPWAPVKSARLLFRMFLLIDPPEHTRLRRVVSSFFSPPSVATLRSSIEEAAAALLDGRDSMELMSEFAYPLPLRFVSDLLGVPEADRPQLHAWSRILVEALEDPIPIHSADVVRYLRLTATGRTRPLRALRAAVGIVSYARGLLRGRSSPEEARLLRLLAEARRAGTLSEDEAVATWVLLVIAGHETTANLIGNGLHALLRHPEVLHRLRQDPSLAPSVVEECLRFDGPVPVVGRLAKADAQVGDVRLRRGETAFLLIGAANRDPAAFDQPDTFDITRPQLPGHVAFGQGIHFCLGAALARLEAEASLIALAVREPTLVSAEWRPSFAVRGLDSLGVRF
jgi:pimeloyl-[acyl-carrier protein] synthase